MVEMIEVMIDSVRVSLTNQQRIVLLRQMGVDRFLPIWIGPYEAEAITISLQEIEIARPQTHDLFIRTLEQLHLRLVRVEIISLRGDVFFANLVVESDGKVVEIDARPSDSIALAVRAHVPILVAREILDEESPEDQEPEESNERLSVFEDFLQNVKLDDGSDEGQDEGEDKPTSPSK
jgi:bifunctional DNase/RNase